jgi:murein DD-endopeptidase MepM/ murein hydrolase activator NlpD
MSTIKWAWLSLFLALCLALVGCGPASLTAVEEAPAPSTATAKAVPEKTPTPTWTPAPSSLPTGTPTQVETSVPLAEQLNCGEAFCQAAWQSVLIRPISGEYYDRIDLTYPYASTKGGALDVHHGVEFPNAYGTPVRAAADGEVVFAGEDDLTLLGPYTGFYGNVVILRHLGAYQGRDLFTLYAHLSDMNVETGEHLAAGQVLGAVGASGAADGSHLHFEVRLDEDDYNKTVNPILWFSPAVNQDGAQTAFLAGQIMDSVGRPLSEFDFVVEEQGVEASEAARFYPVTYVHYDVNAHPILGENFVIPDIPAGAYRLAFINGRFYEFSFTLEPGSLGFIQIQLD